MDTYFYKYIASNKRASVKAVLDYYCKKLDSVNELKHALDKFNDGSSYLVVKCNDYGIPSIRKDPCYNISSISFWKRIPTTYSDCMKSFRAIPLLSDSVEFAFTNSDGWRTILCDIYYASENSELKSNNLNSNSKENGKDQNQLQGEADSNSGCYEGSILYGRRNRPQLATGRHCDQARAQIQEVPVRGGKIYVSTRCPEVLGSISRDRVLGDCTREGSSTPGGIRIPSYCQGVSGDSDPAGVQMRLMKCKDDCTQIGDAYTD